MPERPRSLLSVFQDGQVKEKRFLESRLDGSKDRFIVNTRMMKKVVQRQLPGKFEPLSNSSISLPQKAAKDQVNKTEGGQSMHTTNIAKSKNDDASDSVITGMPSNPFKQQEQQSFSQQMNL